MFGIKKLIASIVSSSLVVGATVTAPIVVTQMNNHESLPSDMSGIPDSKRYFWLKSESGLSLKFNDIDEAVDFILGNKNISGFNSGNTTKYESYIGDFNSATNSLFNNVDVSNLYAYKKEYIKDAYKTINGGYVDDLYFAAKSYLEKYRFLWMDQEGELYTKQSDAIAANKVISESKTLGVSFYRIWDNYANKEVYINPLNTDDINIFKKIALRNLGYNSANESFDVIKLFGTENKFVPINSIFESGSYDSFVNTTYELLRTFSKYKNQITYNVGATLTNNTWSLRSKTKYKRYSVPGASASGSNASYYLPSNDSNDQTNANFSYEIYEYDKNTGNEKKSIPFI